MFRGVQFTPKSNQETLKEQLLGSLGLTDSRLRPNLGVILLLVSPDWFYSNRPKLGSLGLTDPILHPNFRVILLLVSPD